MSHSLATMELSPRPVSSRRIRLLAGLMAGMASLAFADKAAEISDDFIEYLGQMEDRDDNWSDFADQAKQDTTKHSEHSSMASVASTHGRDDGKTVSGRSHP